MKEFRRTDSRFRWGYRAPEFEARHPELRPLADTSVTELAASATAGPAMRAAYRLMQLVPPIRDGMRLHRFALP